MAPSLVSVAFVSFTFYYLFAAPIDYDGTSTVTINSMSDWSAKYAVGQSCDQDGLVELTIDIKSISDEADLVLGFGTQNKYFSIFNPFDSAMCLPCTGSTPTGALFVTPPRGNPLRTADNSLGAQYSDTSNALGARAALVNNENQEAQWDKVIGEGSDIGNNAPLKLIVITDGSTTTVQVTKDGVTSPQMAFTSTFGNNEELFLFLGVDNGFSTPESFELNGIEKLTQCYPSGPIEYDGSSDVLLYKNDEWSAKYPVGDSCDGDGEYILTIDIEATSSEADLVLGFGTEKNYFALFNAYDDAMCLPCSPVRYGNLFVTPPTGQQLRRADTTTTAQYGATTNTLGARAALVNNQDQTANYEKIIENNEPMGQNESPIVLKVSTNAIAQETTVEVTKNGQSSTTMTFTSTFNCDQPLFLFLGIDNANEETFKLKGINQNSECIPTAMCCANTGPSTPRMDKKCSKKKNQKKCESLSPPCEYMPCGSVVVDEEGEYWVADDNDLEKKMLMRSVNGIYEIKNDNIWLYSIGSIIMILFIFAALYRYRYVCSEYKQLDEVNSTNMA